MRELVRHSTEIRAFEPDSDAARWEALYDRFLTVAGVRLGAVA
jgi:hypothetical protein